MVAEAIVRPRSPLRLPRPVVPTRGGEGRVTRLIHAGGVPVVLRAELAGDGAPRASADPAGDAAPRKAELAGDGAPRASADPAGDAAPRKAEPAGDGVLRLHAEAADPAAAAFGLQRLRFWTGVDDDLAAFHARFADDPLIGASVREAPWTRPFRRPMPFEVLASAICEQLVDDERSRAIKHALVRRHGPRLGELGDFPDAEAVAALAPAELERCGLAPKRALTLLRASREVAAGRVDLLDPARREAGWRRLRALPGVGPWTLSILALHGQGHHDALAAGDFAYRAVVGPLLHGRRGAMATEAEVVAFFAPYAGWRGLAGWHVLRVGARSAGVHPPGE